MTMNFVDWNEFSATLQEKYPEAVSMDGTLYANGVRETSWSVPSECFGGDCVARWGIYGVDEGEIYY